MFFAHSVLYENKKVHTEYLYAQLAQFLNDKQKSVIQFSNSVFQLKPIRFAQLNQQMEKTEIHRKKRVETAYDRIRRVCHYCSVPYPTYFRFKITSFSTHTWSMCTEILRIAFAAVRRKCSYCGHRGYATPVLGASVVYVWINATECTTFEIAQKIETCKFLSSLSELKMWI